LRTKSACGALRGSADPVQFDLRLILGIAVAFPDIGMPLRRQRRRLSAPPVMMSILADTDIRVSS
jgi:hypothetical protein